MKAPKTLQDAIQHFGDYENCREFMIASRWPDGKVRCPYCDSEKVTYLAKAKLYRCYGDHPKQKFSLKIGTVFEDSPIPLEKWLPVVWMIVNCRNGVSSYEISRAIGVTQKSAWFMLHRVRLAMSQGSLTRLGGSGNPVEVDETFIGGKVRNMHKTRKLRLARARSEVRNADSVISERYWGKTAVIGALERGGKVKAHVLPNRRGKIVQEIVRQSVEPGTEIMTDEFSGYQGLSDQYVHQIINHLDGYVREHVSTNGIENFWSLLKRGLGGTYVAVEPFHLFRYVDEQAFRFNHRLDAHGNKLTDAQRFQAALSQIVGKRLTYEQVTGKVGETSF